MTGTADEQIAVALDELKDRGIGERRRAELEARIYALVPGDQRRSGRSDTESVLRRLYQLEGGIGCRSVLHNAGAVADPLWRLVDEEGVAIGTASRLLTEARKRARARATEVAVEIDEGIDAWMHRTVLSQTADGRKFRRTVEVREPSPEEALAEIRRAVTVYVDAFGKSIERAAARRLAAETVADLDALLQGVVLRVRREQKRATDAAAEERPMLTLRTVRDACELLTVQAPRVHGQPVDIDAARKRYRTLARQYHPDVTGRPETSDLFQAVVAAFRDIETYNEEATHDAQGRQAREGG